MKTRIKVTTSIDKGVETVKYQAQCKPGLFSWKRAYDYIKPDAFDIIRMSGSKPGELGFAQKVVDVLLEDLAEKLRQIAVEDSKKVTYIKYP